MMTGAGGNMALFVGDEKALLIDDQYGPLSDKIKAKVKEITDLPIHYLINTHWHGDHTGGNANFANDGAQIIAHKNVRERLSTDQFMKAFSRKVDAKSPDYWPVITFGKDINLHMGDEDIWAFHIDNAHTDGDAIVYFVQSNVMHMGDTYFAKRYPFIDLSSGGSIDGAIAGLEDVRDLANDDTRIIPGHGELSDKAELAEYIEVLKDVRDKVAGMIEAGLSFEEIQAANPSAEYDETWGTGFINPESFVNTIYTDLIRDED
jgi:glyoxylase-like metal-dependent hydrolase (beta-lactamase superfamily II)